ncbi:MAG: alkene reductase [Bacteroidota bacterium]
MKLFESYAFAGHTLQNRVAMAPMTRCRAIENIPNELMATYYKQRASIGLLITEGTAPSPNGLGYARIPGIFNQAQIEGWKLVTDAVHEAGGKIFLQIMHTGRVSHPLNMPEGAKLVSTTTEPAPGEMYTDQEGSQAHPAPHLMNADDIVQAKAEFVQAAKNAIEAGFDGVEIHAANGYLVEQFLNKTINQLTNAYGGSNENRNRFAIEVAQEVVAAIGKEKTGIRLSPYGVFNGTGIYEEIDDQFEALAKALNEIGLAYIHLVDHEAMGAPQVSPEVKRRIRQAFSGTLILSGGYDKDRAEADLATGKGDLIAFGRPSLANPDLVERMQTGAEIAAPDFDTFYTPGEKGYTDYPVLATNEA